MDNLCFLDIETKKIADDFPDKWGKPIPSWLEPDKEICATNILSMGFGVGATFDNKAMTFWTDSSELLLYLLSPSVDAIVTFNGSRFDFAVLLGDIEPQGKDGQVTESFKDTYNQLMAKSIDVMSEVERTLGKKVGLDSITSALFETKKDFDGKHWWKYYNSTSMQQRTDAINYLLGDVIQLYKIYGVASELGKLAYRDHLGNTHKFNINIKKVEDLKNG